MALRSLHSHAGATGILTARLQRESIQETASEVTDPGAAQYLAVIRRRLAGSTFRGRRSQRRRGARGLGGRCGRVTGRAADPLPAAQPARARRPAERPGRHGTSPSPARSRPRGSPSRRDAAAPGTRDTSVLPRAPRRHSRLPCGYGQVERHTHRRHLRLRRLLISISLLRVATYRYWTSLDSF